MVVGDLSQGCSASNEDSAAEGKTAAVFEIPVDADSVGGGGSADLIRLDTY